MVTCQARPIQTWIAMESLVEVRIVTFPETRVACITHLGSPQAEHTTARRLIAWKLEHRLLDQSKYRTYGLHYGAPRADRPDDYRVDVCLSTDREILPNPHGIVEKLIPSLRCAYARDVGSRLNNRAAAFLYEQWLPSSEEELSGDPLIFHYVNVGPNVKDEEAITDVYMPLRA